MTSGDKKSQALWVLMGAMDGVSQRARITGDKDAYLQIFDQHPEDETDAEIQEQRLLPDDARNLVGQRIREGFTGIAGFVCLVEEGGQWRLYGEVFDTETNVSAGGAVPMRRTFLGKFKPTTDRIELIGSPSIPGVFTSKADAKREHGKQAEGPSASRHDESSHGNTPSGQSTGDTEISQGAMAASPPTAVDTNVGGTRFFDLSTVADTVSVDSTELECGSCGVPVDAEDRFCSACGQDLAAL